MSVTVCVCMCFTLVDQNKTASDKSVIFHPIVGLKNTSNDVLGDVEAHDLDILFEGQA